MNRNQRGGGDVTLGQLSSEVVRHFCEVVVATINGTTQSHNHILGLLLTDRFSVNKCVEGRGIHLVLFELLGLEEGDEVLDRGMHVSSGRGVRV